MSQINKKVLNRRRFLTTYSQINLYLYSRSRFCIFRKRMHQARARKKNWVVETTNYYFYSRSNEIAVCSVLIAPFLPNLQLNVSIHKDPG